MTKLIAFLSLLCLSFTIYIPFVSSGESVPIVTSPSRMEYFTMTTPWNGNQRTIRIYLPAGYDSHGLSYPVLYWSDGQSYVGKDEAPFIMVGIDSEWWERWDTLSPWVNWQMHLWFGISSPRGGLGDEYLSFLLTVKDTVEIRYRTTNTAWIAGGSMGGLFALYAGTATNEFSKVCAFSPAVWFSSGSIYDWIETNKLLKYLEQLEVDVWIYQGGNEYHDEGYPVIGDFPTIYVTGSELACEITNCTFVFNPTGLHNTITFRKYFSQAFEWLESESE